MTQAVGGVGIPQCRRFGSTGERLRTYLLPTLEKAKCRSGGSVPSGNGAAVASLARGLRTHFVVRRGNRHSFVPVDQVDWIDGAVDRIRAIRTHESGSHVIEMIDGAQVRTSRPYAERVRALLR
jgi:hypothetical protein